MQSHQQVKSEEAVLPNAAAVDAASVILTPADMVRWGGKKGSDKYAVVPEGKAIKMSHIEKSNRNIDDGIYFGWKMHISVDAGQVHKASALVVPIAVAHEVEEFKIVDTQEHVRESGGKIITIYFYNEEKDIINHRGIEKLVQNIEEILIRNHIPTGLHVIGDRQLTNSQYISYRCGYRAYVVIGDDRIPREKTIAVQQNKGVFISRVDLRLTKADVKKITAKKRTEPYNPLGYTDVFHLGQINAHSTIGLRAQRFFTKQKKDLSPEEGDNEIFEEIKKLLNRNRKFSIQKFQDLWNSLGERKTIYTLE